MSAVLEQRVVSQAPLRGGRIADVARIELVDGQVLVEKRLRQRTAGGENGDLTLQGWMLRYLADHAALPLPEVLEATAEHLILAYVPHDLAICFVAATG